VKRERERKREKKCVCVVFSVRALRGFDFSNNPHDTTPYPQPGIAFGGADSKRQRQLEAIGLEQLAAEMAWLRRRLEGEDYGATRAKEVGEERS
jgi:hypothetical protein